MIIIIDIIQSLFASSFLYIGQKVKTDNSGKVPHIFYRVSIRNVKTGERGGAVLFLYRRLAGDVKRAY